MRKEFPMEDSGRTDKDDRFEEQPTIIKNTHYYNFSH
jgi:hypothetical protein